MTTHLVWLRNDLRITDNKALHAACSDPKARVLAVFIATPQQWREHEMAPRQAALIHASLRAVQQALAQKGIALHCHAGTDFAASIDWRCSGESVCADVSSVASPIDIATADETTTANRGIMSLLTRQSSRASSSASRGQALLPIAEQVGNLWMLEGAER